jgi:hypothetical protein
MAAKAEAGFARITGQSSKLAGETAAAESVASECRISSCFPAGTLVATVDRLVAIEKIAQGDEVWAFDPVDSCWRPRRVLQTFGAMHEGYSVRVTVADAVEETIEASLFHPFWVVGGKDLQLRPRRENLPSVPEGATTLGRWVDACDLLVGDEVLLRNGHMVPVRRACVQPYSDYVYNFEVDELQCYAVGWNGVLVHNDCAVAAGGADTPSPGAVAARDALVTESKAAGQFPSTISAAEDISTGAVSAKASAAPPAIVAPELAAAAEPLGGVGARTTCGNIVGACSEFQAANDLLLNGSKLTNIRVTQAIRPRTGQVVPRCANCVAMFGPAG